jgi:hypothetical protein
MPHVPYRQRNKISKEEWEAISKLTENAVILPIHTSESEVEPDRERLFGVMYDVRTRTPSIVVLDWKRNADSYRVGRSLSRKNTPT